MGHQRQNRFQIGQRNASGFSLTEVLVVILIMGVTAAMSLPAALSALQGYRLHSEASGIAGYLNLAQMHAASQYAPHRVVINVTSGTYMLEKLCGMDPACTGAYQSYATPQVEDGPQYIQQGNAFSSCRPTGVSVRPPLITADLAGCPTPPDPFYIYFNTRGQPVDSSGNPVGNGGAALYITGQNGLVDAVTASPGGRVSIWAWNSLSTQWISR